MADLVGTSSQMLPCLLMNKVLVFVLQSIVAVNCAAPHACTAALGANKPFLYDVIVEYK